MAQGWPVGLIEHDAVGVRPLRLRDGPAWSESRIRNQAWLEPWEATPLTLGSPVPWRARQTLPVFSQMLRDLRKRAKSGLCLHFAVVVGGDFAGQLTVNPIVRGAANSGQVGYWVDQRYAGRGVTPLALALVADHCFGPVGLHRLEAHVRPENHASRRVMDKLGFREEGLHRRLLAVEGEYRDHLSYALLAEDRPDGVLRTWYTGPHAPRAPLR